MNDPGFWGQSWWQGAGVIVSSVIAIAAIVLSVKQNKIKKLSYRILYSGSLLNINEQVKSDLSILYKGHAIEHLNVFEIQMINNGKLPIKKDDFESEIELSFKNCNKIFNIEKTGIFPNNLSLCYSNSDSRVSFEPMLLNPGDFFSLRITFDGKDRDFDVLTRIEGIKEINMILGVNDNNIFINNVTFLRIWLWLCVSYSISLISAIHFNFYPDLVTIFFALLASIVLFVNTLSERLSEKVAKVIKNQ